MEATPRNEEKDRLQNTQGMPIDERRMAKFCRRYHINKLSIVHSRAPGEPKASHPWDMMVEFESGESPGRFAMVGMQIELSTLAGRRIDLGTYADLSAHTPRTVLDRAKTVFLA